MRSRLLIALFLGVLVLLPLTASATPPCVGSGCTVISNDGGTAATGISQPAGGAGLTGWLSGIYKAVLPPAIAPIFSSVLEAGHVLTATTGTIYGAQVNTSAADYVMLLNLSSIPASGTTVTPVGMWRVPANATVSLSFSPGLTLSTGIVVVCSSTGPTTFTPDPTCWFGSGIVQ